MLCTVTCEKRLRGFNSSLFIRHWFLCTSLRGASLLFCVLVTWFDLQSSEQQNLCGRELASTLWLSGHGWQVYVVREERQHLETLLQPLPRNSTIDEHVLPSKALLGTRTAVITQCVPPPETMQKWNCSIIVQYGQHGHHSRSCEWRSITEAIHSLFLCPDYIFNHIWMISVWQVASHQEVNINFAFIICFLLK